MRFLQSNWMASLLGMVLFVATLVWSWRPPPAEVASEESGPEAPVTGPSWEFHNPEVDLLISELRKEKEDLQKRETDLNELAARLQTERAEINQVTQTVQQLQADFDQNITRVKEEETTNLKKLAKIYSNMAPDGAAVVFKELDDVAVVKVMMFMKDSETGPILEVLAKISEADAKRVAGISERLRLAIKENKEAKKTPSP